MAQNRAGELGEEALDEVEPGAVLGREGELESAGRAIYYRARSGYYSRASRFN